MLGPKFWSGFSLAVYIEEGKNRCTSLPCLLPTVSSMTAIPWTCPSPRSFEALAF